MFGIRYMKASPTTYVIHYKSGRIIREGAGLSYFYYAPSSSLVAVPLSSVDVPFVFNEVSADYQAVTVQGQLTFRVADAKRLAALLDFSLNSKGTYTSRDPDKLNDRVVAAAHVLTSALTHRMTLKEVLVSHHLLSTEILEGLRTSDIVLNLGLEILSLAILGISPSPEMAKALEAEAREELQRKSDEAIYARRNAAVEQERRIRESELNTEIAVEEKRRVKRETQMAADIAVEQQRTTFLDQQVENEKKLSDSRAYATEAVLKPVRDLDWRMVLALNSANMNASQSIAMAFRELAANAEKIGTLNITPDLLDTLLADEKPKPAPRREK